MTIYTRKFYEWMQVGSHRSAEIIVPYIMQLIRSQRVIDIGCGTGEWLEVFKKQGVKEVLGVDGGWFDESLLKISSNEFIKLDFTKEELKIGRTFDLAITLEVINHIPKDRTRDFIRLMTQVAPVVLFSAPIPYQGGSGARINEQWPAYWAELFKENGFLAADCLRDKIWADQRIERWYAQNMLIFADKSRISHLPELIKEIDSTRQPPLNRIHPDIYTFRMSQGVRNFSCREIISALPHTLWKAIKGS